MKSRAGKKDGEIIVKRRRKGGHDDAHGGAWKVAFADFTMAMMALFMVLWVITPQSAMQNPSSGDIASNPIVDGGAGVFEGTSKSPIELDGLPMPAKPEVHEKHEKTVPEVLAAAAKALKIEVPDATDDKAESKDEQNADAPRHYDSSVDLQELAALIRAVSGKVDAIANLEVNVVPQGLRILIKDDQQRFMFARGSANLDPHFAKLLAVLADVLAKVDNKLILSGHTDAVPYKGKTGYNNWNLSGDRALRARNVLVASGLPASHVLQVTAQADGMPLHPEDPENGANRRIEMLLLTNSAEKLYRQLFGDSYARVQVSQDSADYVAPPKQDQPQTKAAPAKPVATPAQQTEPAAPAPAPANSPSA